MEQLKIKDNNERIGLNDIIGVLLKEGTVTESKIYWKLKAPRATIQYRINKLERAGIAKRSRELDGQELMQNVVYLTEKGRNSLVEGKLPQDKRKE